MNAIKRAFAVLMLIMMGFSMMNAQNVLDRAYVKEHNPARKPIPYPHLREADVMWHHRIYRVLDLREKMNFPMFYPQDENLKDRRALFTIIKKSLLPPDGSPPKLTAYRDDDQEEFAIKMNTMEVQSEISSTDTVMTNENPQDLNSPLVPKLVVNTLDARSVTKYWLKEDWFFDKQRSVLEARVIGIMAIKSKESGGVKGDAATFWIYFPELRPIIAKEEVFNRHNDAERMSFDDLFWKRQFSSYIFKENNVYDRMISSYTGQGNISALLEAERIKNGIFTLEHDLWHF
jgi:gliding motility associated protien GldN